MLARVPGDAPGAPPADVIIAMVPARDYRIHDNWHVLGLRATGSKQAVIENVFVPSHRVLSFYEMMRKFTAPGHSLHRNPLYRLPLFPIVLIEAGAVVVGLAQAALDALVEYAEHKRLTFPPFSPLKDTRRVQAAVGKASGRLEGARAGLHELIRRQEARAERLDRGPAFTDAEMRRDHALMLEMLRLGHECVDIAFVTAGSSAARTPSVLERVFRDMAMTRTHYFFDAERVGENVGAITFGLPPYTDY
jgi:3-hydroxy-9,10-secoandrosta-1,3,5(10)-triene-9,17-dione monooxygenase